MIKLKLILSSIVLTIGLITLFFFIDSSFKTLESLKDIQTKVVDINKDILTLRRNEKDFLLRKELKYVDMHKLNCALIYQDISILKDHLKKQNIELLLDINKLQSFIKEYQKLFYNIVQQQQKIGLNERSGLYLSLDNSVGIVEDMLLEEIDEELSGRLLDIRKEEKNFMLRKELKYVESFRSKIDNLINYQLLFRDMKSYLENYKDDFLELAENEKIIGLDENIGLKGKMRKNIHSTEYLLKDITKKLEILISKKLHDLKVQNGFIVILIIFATIISTLMILNSIRKPLDELDKKTKELEELNNELEIRVNKQIVELRKKDTQLKQQSLMAEMGQMIGAIAHQIKQPIAIIQLLAQNITLNKELGLDTDYDKISTDITKQTQFMTKTIDLFRNFFNPNKEKELMRLDNILDDTLYILNQLLLEITVIREQQELKHRVYIDPNEIIQVCMNIIKNSKDAQCEREIENKIIKIDLYEDERFQLITIHDNGGGIEENIKDKIFESYFTTKGEDRGTGIGLDLAKQIIEEKHSGELYVNNESFNYEGKDHFGAKFYIKLPFKSDDSNTSSIS